MADSLPDDLLCRLVSELDGPGTVDFALMGSHAFDERGGVALRLYLTTVELLDEILRPDDREVVRRTADLTRLSLSSNAD